MHTREQYLLVYDSIIFVTCTLDNVRQCQTEITLNTLPENKLLHSFGISRENNETQVIKETFHFSFSTIFEENFVDFLQ